MLTFFWRYGVRCFCVPVGAQFCEVIATCSGVSRVFLQPIWVVQAHNENAHLGMLLRMRASGTTLSTGDRSNSCPWSQKSPVAKCGAKIYKKGAHVFTGRVMVFICFRVINSFRLSSFGRSYKPNVTNTWRSWAGQFMWEAHCHSPVECANMIYQNSTLSAKRSFLFCFCMKTPMVGTWPGIDCAPIV